MVAKLGNSASPATVLRLSFVRRIIKNPRALKTKQSIERVTSDIAEYSVALMALAPSTI